jgi:hypothetical protein
MRSVSISSVLVAAACSMNPCMASSGTESRRYYTFGGRLPFIHRISSSPSDNDFIQPATRLPQQQSYNNNNYITTTVPAIMDCNINNNNNHINAPNDRAARYAVQYDHELQRIRAADHAYLQHDDEFPVIPASNQPIIVRRNGPLNGQVWEL